MEVNIRKIFGLILMIILLSLIFSGKVFASDASISVSPNSCNVGDSVTVTINMPQYAIGYRGNLVINYADGSSETIDTLATLGSGFAGNYSTTKTINKAGNHNISISLKLYDINGLDAVTPENQELLPRIVESLAASVNVTDPNSTPTQPTENNNQPNTQPDSTPPPAEVVVVNFKDVNETMYVTDGNTGVNMRQNCGKNTGLITTLQPGTEVTRTGIGDKSKDGYSWSRISYNGETGYVITSRLTYDKPEEKPPENTVENNTVSNNEITNNTVSNNSVLNGIKNIADELGAIPEVGLNIMTFIFVGSCIVCSIIIIYVKRKIAK